MMNTPTYLTARSAYGAGICVVPPREDGSKRPLTEMATIDGETKDTWMHWAIERPSKAKMRRWYGDGSDPTDSTLRTGIGYLGGTISGGLTLFETDEADLYDRVKEAAIACGLGPLLLRVEDGYFEVSPGGGKRVLYRCPDGITSSTKLARRPKRHEEMEHERDRVKTLIETRGEGGYMIVAPSNGHVHPTGGQYRLLKGGVSSIVTITREEQADLWELARAFDEMPDTRTEDAGHTTGAGSTAKAEGGRPGDDFNSRATWEDTGLYDAGWQRAYAQGGKTCIRRPGKRVGISASLDYKGSGYLYVFSTSTDFEAERAYNKFAVYTILNHNGDFKAATKALVGLGYGAQTPQGAHADQATRPESEQAEADQGSGSVTQYGAEILNAAPLTVSKPLSLIDGRAYAATWLHMQITEPGGSTARGGKSRGGGGKGKEQEPPKPSPARVYNAMRMAIVRDDGALFADGTQKPLDDLGIDLHLSEQPPPDKLWRAPSVRAYTGIEKYRPQPADVFNRAKAIVDTFIDFDRSLADQETMCEFITCYILATWFSDAFNVAGNIWPNGERGSGKTQLITVVADLSYLGQVILAGGSYASLRDLADYGAFLAFDDAENLSNPKTSDPDKRALLLAGNRRGNTVPVKEPDGVRGWRTRYVSTYCFRGFTAIRMPDPVLASRTIVVPLIRTNDRKKANADPLDYKLWPYGRRQLLDDLWALSLTHLSELPAYDEFVSQNARLSGRNLEPWRAVLAVAAWLNSKGVADLWERMEGLSMKYQDERPNVETGDITTLLVRALAEEARRAISDVSAISDIRYENVLIKVKTAELTKTAHDLAESDEVDMNLEAITSRVVGRAMGRLRFKSTRENGKGTRMWEFTVGEVKRWGERYSLNLDPPAAK